MRGLSKTFLNCLKRDFLSEIVARVKADHDLNLEIRDAYINLYYKGNALLRLCEAGSLLHYKAEIHEKFLEGVDLCLDFTEESVPLFLSSIPLLKENIIRYGSHSLELEYEQMVIRANNFEGRNNTDYFIVDRQYAGKEGRFDLTGIYWDRNNRKRNQEVPLCLMEVKFALNSDIQEIHQQLSRYYQAIAPRAAELAEEMQTVFRQKLELGLYRQPKERLDAMKTLSFSDNIDAFQFIVVLVDYNQNSTLLGWDEIAKLPFANQVKVFQTGFGMWRQNVRPLGELSTLDRAFK